MTGLPRFSLFLCFAAPSALSRAQGGVLRAQAWGAALDTGPAPPALGKQTLSSALALLRLDPHLGPGLTFALSPTFPEAGPGPERVLFGGYLVHVLPCKLLSWLDT